MSKRVAPAAVDAGSIEVAYRVRDLTIEQAETGKIVRVGDFWEKGNGQPVLLVLLRRFGCAVCRMMAANMSALKPEFDQRGITMIGIATGKEGYEEFVKAKFWTGEIYFDEEKHMYNALGCQCNSWKNAWGLFDPQVQPLFKVARKKNIENNFRGDINQYGATFMLAPPDGSLLFGHYQTSKCFTPDMPALMTSVNIPVPEDYDPYGAPDPTREMLQKEAVAQVQQDSGNETVSSG